MFDNIYKKLSYINSFGDMGLREGFGGEWWWTLNMNDRGEGGVLVSFLGRMGWGLWKNIRRVWGKFYNHTRFEVDNGSKVRFWHDLWCGDMALRDVFPVLFCIARARDWNFLEVSFSGT